MAGIGSFLSAVGRDFVKVFSWLGSSKGQAAVTGAETVANVAVGIANPGAAAGLLGIEALINAGIKEVVSIESLAAAAGQQSGTGAQKLAAVTSAIAPNMQAFLTSIGISDPTAADVQKYTTAVANGIVAILNALPVPETGAAATPKA